MAHALERDWRRSLATFQLCLSAHPTYLPALVDSGRTMLMAARYAEALVRYREALEFEPASAALHCGVAEALSGLERFVEAESTFQASLRLEPDRAETWAALAALLHRLRRDSERWRCLEKAAKLEPDHPIHAANLAAALTTVGRLPEAVDAYRRALLLDPGAHVVRSAFLNMQLHNPACSPPEFLREHRNWELHHGHGVRRKLRVGYVTGELQAGQCAYFVGPVLTNHDPTKILTYCYYTYPIADRQTEAVRRCTDRKSVV